MYSNKSSSKLIDIELSALIFEIRQTEEQLSFISKKGLLDNDVKKMAQEAGYDPDSYKKQLRARYISQQRSFNKLLLSSEESFGFTPLIIDTFDDFLWKDHKIGYSLLDKVEIDIEQRIKTSSWLKKTTVIGETSDYVFYCCDHSFVRKSKIKNEFVYFGEGTTIAAIFDNWLYWYEWGSIMSDKFIMRRSVDGRQTEKLDWLSNKKTMEVIGESAHCVSEDRVLGLNASNDSLVIRVRRITGKDNIYNIIVTSNNGTITTKKVIESGDFEETNNGQTIDTASVTEVLEKQRQLFESLLAKKGKKDLSLNQCELNEKEIIKLLQQVRSDERVLVDKDVSLEDYYSCVYWAVFNAGIAMAYLSTHDSVDSNFYDAVLAGCESVNDEIFDGDEFLVLRLLNGEFGEKHDKMLSDIHSIERPLEDQFLQLFGTYLDESFTNLIDATNKVLLQAFRQGFIIGQTVMDDFNSESNQEGYYFENPMELAIYGKLFSKDKTVLWLSGSNYLDEYRKGYQLFEQRQYAKAIAVYENCLKLNPIGLSARFEMCEAYISLHRFQDAQKVLIDMQAFLIGEKDIARFYRRMGFIETEKGNYKLSAACYQYSERFEKHPSIAQELMYIKSQGGRFVISNNPDRIISESNIPLLKKNNS